MPELPEVERATALIRSVACGKVIVRVETSEDTIVYTGTDHTEFAKELTGRSVVDAARYGKVFYIKLDGEGRAPVLHFGMTGMLQVKGQLPTYYRKTPKTASSDWPPRFMKAFILHLKNEATGGISELAFLDARRLGRIRLCASPLTEPPISTLGFDPILSMPVLTDFQTAVLRRSCPIKALLLDQSFSAGVGNWVADEILYHAGVHPERRCNTLAPFEVQKLHEQTQYVCKTAVAVNADDTKFPENWLFKHRWGKGKKKHTLLLPSGEPATIKWVTVGGRTSAYVAELQQVTGGINESEDPPSVNQSDSDSDLTPLEEEEEITIVAIKAKRTRKNVVTATPSKRVTKRSKFF
ncbi:unnamed protein product [Somion occarium]|uniref:Formamidopyrimidine-DNA glycosylase catalytic domain-containing protein n=2 Tax=Somion occarium TaxID=3059160 RepID=A0ABP1CM24_9APHY